jgi:metal-sulfur cluster biosynthetic enzyme
MAVGNALPAMEAFSNNEANIFEKDASPDVPPAGATNPDLAAILAALGQCYDPCCRERGVSLVDLGLIHEVRLERGRVTVAMLLTGGWFSLSASPEQMIEAELKRLPGVKQVVVEMLWNPVWTPARMSQEARRKFSLPLA